MIRPTDLFDLSDPALERFFEGCTYVWEAVPMIKSHVTQLVGDRSQILGTVMPGAYVSERPVFIAPGARIEPGAYVQGPAYIGPGAVVRHGAYVRENVILMAGSILGHASEAKNRSRNCVCMSV